jgi:hypothetical protein
MRIWQPSLAESIEILLQIVANDLPAFNDKFYASSSVMSRNGSPPGELFDSLRENLQSTVSAAPVEF